MILIGAAIAALRTITNTPVGQNQTISAQVSKAIKDVANQPKGT
jgi:hypothetical protein